MCRNLFVVILFSKRDFCNSLEQVDVRNVFVEMFENNTGSDTNGKSSDRAEVVTFCHILLFRRIDGLAK